MERDQKLLASGNAIQISPTASVYTVPANKRAVIKTLHVTCSSISAMSISISLNSKIIAYRFPLNNNALSIENFNQVLESGEKLNIYTETGNGAVSYYVSGEEIPL